MLFSSAKGTTLSSAVERAVYALPRTYRRHISYVSVYADPSLDTHLVYTEESRNLRAQFGRLNVCFVDAGTIVDNAESVHTPLFSARGKPRTFCPKTVSALVVACPQRDALPFCIDKPDSRLPFSPQQAKRFIGPGKQSMALVYAMNHNPTVEDTLTRMKAMFNLQTIVGGCAAKSLEVTFRRRGAAINPFLTGVILSLPPSMGVATHRVDSLLGIGTPMNVTQTLSSEYLLGLDNSNPLDRLVEQVERNHASSYRTVVAMPMHDASTATIARDSSRHRLVDTSSGLRPVPAEIVQMTGHMHFPTTSVRVGDVLQAARVDPHAGEVRARTMHTHVRKQCTLRPPTKSARKKSSTTAKKKPTKRALSRRAIQELQRRTRSRVLLSFGADNTSVTSMPSAPRNMAQHAGLFPAQILGTKVFAFSTQATVLNDS
eukprot:PhM_4_TR2316/c0_g1_i1/m.45920